MSTTKPVHARLDSVTHQGTELMINGQSVTTLAERVGRTPFYAYDRSAMAQRVAMLRGALPDTVELHYAIKANPMPAVIAHMRTLVDGFDVASHREMLAALDAGMPPSEVSFAGPAKQESELRAAIAAGICINCESETELQRIGRQSEALGITARVALRVNPTFELKGSGMKMSGSPRQFGIDADRIPAAIEYTLAAGLRFDGLHIFCGSQNLQAQSIVEANRLTLELAIELCNGAPSRPRFVNIGGGYGIPYFPGERPLDLDTVGSALGENLDQLGKALDDIQIVVELGRYMVGEAGYYVARVSDIKLSQGHKFVMVDGGLHHHLSNSGNFGQVLRKNYPVLVGNKVGETPLENVSIVGPLCTPLDLVADRMDLPPIQIGDLIVVAQSGAYGYSASPHLFLSHPPAVEILV